MFGMVGRACGRAFTTCIPNTCACILKCGVLCGEIEVYGCFSGQKTGCTTLPGYNIIPWDKW